MFIAIATISILAITGLVWLSKRVLAFRICPVCAGVSGTWLWMLVAKFFGYETDLIIIAALMGGSVVGIAYQIEKRFILSSQSADSVDTSPLPSSTEGRDKSLAGKPAADKLLLWKTLFISVGFTAVYGILYSRWDVFIPAVIAAALLIAFFRKPRQNMAKNKTVEDLERKMKNCC